MKQFTWGTVTSVGPLRVKLDGDTAALPFEPDSLIDPSTLAPGDRLRCELAANRLIVHGKSGGAPVPSANLPGEVKITAAAAAPTGWILCQGQSLLRSSYPALFTALGTTYGAADSTHFSVPDLRGRVPVGRDSSQTEFDVLGEASGAKTHVLTTAEMPSHTHALVDVALAAGTGTTNYSVGTNPKNKNPDTTGATGGGGAHNNLQPYIVLNYIIKT